MLKKITVLLFFLLSPITAFADSGNIAVIVDGVPIYEETAASRASSGMAFNTALSDEEKEAAYAQAYKKALTELITEQVCVNEAQRLGLDQLESTQEEADRRYEKMISAVENYIRVSYPNLTQEVMDEQVDAMLKVLGQSRESYRESAFRATMISALETCWLDNYPDPSEDAIQNYYDELYSAQKELFDTDENAFEAAMLNNELVVYRPVDLKLIRKAEFNFSDEVIRYIRQLRQLGVSNAESQIEDYYHMLADEVEPVYEELLSGDRNFSDLLEELEPGSAAKANYFHPTSTRFGQDYYERADAFSEIGEISTAYLIPNGYAVLEYYGTLPAGVVPVEDAAEMIREILIAEGSKDYLTQMKQNLLDNAEIRFTSTGEK